MTAQNEVMSEKNAKLKEEICKSTQDYQARIQEYFTDMEKNQDFITLLRSKTAKLLEERKALLEAEIEKTTNILSPGRGRNNKKEIGKKIFV